MWLGASWYRVTDMRIECENWYAIHIEQKGRNISHTRCVCGLMTTSYIYIIWLCQEEHFTVGMGMGAVAAHGWNFAYPSSQTYIYIYIYHQSTIHTYMNVVVNFDALAQHRQAIFELKGDKLSFSAECRIRTEGLRHLFASRLNACWQTDWAIEDQAKNLNTTARAYDQQAFSPLDLTANWLSHLALAIYMFVVVNFDALAQASDIRIERRQVVFLCWMQDSNPRSQTPIRQQTECLLTNRLSYRESS